MVTFRNANSFDLPAFGQTTVSFGSGLEGDLLIAFAVSDGAYTDPGMPFGWNRLVLYQYPSGWNSNKVSLVAFTRFAPSSSSQNAVMTNAGGNGWGLALRYGDAEILDSASAFNGSGSSTQVSAPSLSPPTSNAVLLTAHAALAYATSWNKPHQAAIERGSGLGGSSSGRRSLAVFERAISSLETINASTAGMNRSGDNRMGASVLIGSPSLPPAAPIITSVTDRRDDLVPKVSWNYSHPQSKPQAKYQINVRSLSGAWLNLPEIVSNQNVALPIERDLFYGTGDFENASDMTGLETNPAFGQYPVPASRHRSEQFAKSGSYSLEASWPSYPPVECWVDKPINVEIGQRYFAECWVWRRQTDPPVRIDVLFRTPELSGDTSKVTQTWEYIRTQVFKANSTTAWVGVKTMNGVDNSRVLIDNLKLIHLFDPGSYRVQVRVADSDGLWSEWSAHYDFVIEESGFKVRLYTGSEVVEKPLRRMISSSGSVEVPRSSVKRWDGSNWVEIQ